MVKTLKSIRFQKKDKYENSIFICSELNPEEEENCETLKTMALKLNESYDTFLPIYYSENYNYSSIRFSKNSKFVPQENCTYDIEYVIKLKNKNDKQYVNCFIQKMKFISKREIDDGVEIEI